MIFEVQTLSYVLLQVCPARKDTRVHHSMLSYLKIQFRNFFPIQIYTILNAYIELPVELTLGQGQQCDGCAETAAPKTDQMWAFCLNLKPLPSLYQVQWSAL